MRLRALLVVGVVLVGCHRDDPPSGSAERATPAPTPTPSGSAQPVTPIPSASAQPVVPKGSARLVVQYVEAVCMTVTIENPVMRRFKVTDDLLVEIRDDDDAGPARREHAYCPPPDGGKPRLDVWQNCRRDETCRITTDEAGASLSVTCGKDTVVLDVEDGHTVLRSRRGTRVIAPVPLRIEPPVKVKREAFVDC